MPTISRFNGVVIKMFYRDHPPPHFHGEYNEDEVIVGINPLEVLEGKVPGNILRKILPWALRYRDELEENWDLARSGQPLKQIPPWEDE
jgi:hypothetical protein